MKIFPVYRSKKWLVLSSLLPLKVSGTTGSGVQWSVLQNIWSRLLHWPLIGLAFFVIVVAVILSQLNTKFFTLTETLDLGIYLGSTPFRYLFKFKMRCVLHRKNQVVLLYNKSFIAFEHSFSLACPLGVLPQVLPLHHVSKNTRLVLSQFPQSWTLCWEHSVSGQFLFTWDTSDLSHWVTWQLFTH